MAYERTTYLTNSCRLSNNGDPNHSQPQRMEDHMNDNLRLDMARLEAKLDVLIAMQTKGSQQVPPTHNQSLNLAEVSLLRTLTIKQHAVSQLVIRGWKNKEIAEVMGVTDNTVKLHVAAVAKKVGVKTRGQVAVALTPLMGKIRDEEYQSLSGGIPLNWGDTVHVGMTDEFAPLYAPQRGARTWD